MKEIKLSQGMVALVDDEDFEELNQYKWHVTRNHNLKRKYTNYYACRFKITNGKIQKIYMHRIISRAKKGEICDHIDGNGLNNLRANLRIVSYSQNCRNRKAWGSSNFLGVCWDKREKKWRASIVLEGKKLGLGHFKSEIDAALTYNKVASAAHGEFVRLNVV